MIKFSDLYILLLSLAASAQCDDNSIQIHIDPETIQGGDGSLNSPFQSIFNAYDHISSEGYINICLKLCIRDTPFSLFVQSDASGENVINDPYKNFKNLVDYSKFQSIQKIHMLAWDPISDTTSTTNAVVLYQDPSIVWAIQHEMELSFSHVTFKQEIWRDQGQQWESEIWRHCHYELQLDASGLSGTGGSYNDLSEEEKGMYTLGQADNSWTACLPDVKDWVVESEGNDFWRYGVFSIEASGALLRMSDWLITEFRFRPSYIINITGGGSVILNNVDFINVEPGKSGHTQQEDRGNKAFQQARGIITSFARQVAADDAQNLVESQNWFFDGADPFQSDDASPKPCGTLTWTGGRVTGLNKDVNLKQKTDDVVQYYGFIDVRHLQSISITQVSFEYNIIPLIYNYGHNYDDQIRAIINIINWARIELTGCTFENNMAQQGTVYIDYDRDLWDYDTSGEAPYDLYSIHSEVITVDNCQFIGNTAFEYDAVANGLTIKTNLPVNISVKNCSFLENNSGWAAYRGALMIESSTVSDNDHTGILALNEWDEDETWYQNNYYSSERSSLFWPWGFYLKLTDNVFSQNKIGTVLVIEKWANVTIQSNTFDNNTDYNYKTAWLKDGSTIQKYIDSGRIRPWTGQFSDQAEFDCNGYELVNELQCASLIRTRYILGLNIIGGNILQQNICSCGTMWQTQRISNSLTIENITLNSNISKSSIGGGLLLETDLSYYIDEKTDNIPVLKYINWIDNTAEEFSASSSGGACINVFDDASKDREKIRLRVESSVFSGNIAKAGTAIYVQGAALTLYNCTFTDNQNTDNEVSKGGSVNFQYALDSTYYKNKGEFVVSQCTFENNHGNYWPDIKTSDSIASETSFIKFQISDTTFTCSEAKIGMGSMWIGQHAFYQEDSEISSFIQSCQFSSISSKQGLGTILIQHVHGVLTLDDVTFDNITSEVLSWGIHGQWRSDPSKIDSNSESTFVKIKNSIIQNCSCGNFIYISDINYSMHIITENLTVQNNKFNFAYIDHGYLTETGSVFSDNSAVIAEGTKGTILYGSNASKVVFTDTQFLRNRADKYGGVVYMSSQGTIVDFYNITAIDNSAQKGGFLFALDESAFNITDSLIESNAADKGSAFFISSCDTVYSSIKNTKIVKNQGYGSLFLIEAHLTLNSSTIESNKADDNSKSSTAGIVLLLSSWRSRDNIFNNQTGISGAFLYATSGSNFTDENSIFSAGQATAGGLGYLITTQVSLVGTLISQMGGENSGIFYASLASSIILKDVKITDTFTAGEPSLIQAQESSLNIENCEFDNFSQTGIFMWAISNSFSVIDSNFTNGGSSDRSHGETAGGAFYFWQFLAYDEILISGCRFENLTAIIGGGLYFQADFPHLYTITNNTFINCTANMGGAIFNSNWQLELSDNVFINNKAINLVDYNGDPSIGDGGAIFTNWPSDMDCVSNYRNNEFKGNQADHDGGGVKWQGIEPANLVTNNTFSKDNVALYGNDIASYPNSLKVMTSSVDRILSNSTSPIIVASGQNVPKEICIGIFDHYDTIISTENSADGAIYAESSSATTISGLTTIGAAKQGVFCFDEFEITAEPGTNVQIGLATSLLTDFGIEYLEFDVEMRKCISGESLIDNQCIICAPGTYSIRTDSKAWEKCPNGAEWYGNNTMVPIAGYWRASKTSDKFFECPLYDACLGGEIQNGQLSLTGWWEEGYEGNKCQVCSDGYSRVGKN